jgi:hypothetical protein
MTCTIQFLECVNEGQTITINYTLTDVDGNPVSSIDLLEYKLSDGINILVDWTELPSVAPAGSFVISGANNIVQGRGLTDRYLTVHSVLAGKDTFKPIKYSLPDDPNVHADSP